MPELYTTEQVSEILKVNGDTVRRWIRDGRIKSVKLPNGCHRIPQSEIDRITRTA